MTSTVACPECDGPATVTERFSLPSTDGPVEHVRIRCDARHHFMMLAERVTEYAPTADPQVA